VEQIISNNFHPALTHPVENGGRGRPDIKEVLTENRKKNEESKIEEGNSLRQTF
jgi:hypothetical protein